MGFYVPDVLAGQVTRDFTPDKPEVVDFPQKASGPVVPYATSLRMYSASTSLISVW